MRIVQVANFYGPRSGGLRTALNHLGAGYAARGHEVTLVVPGPHRSSTILPGGVYRMTMPAPAIPGTGGYRLLDRHRVRRLLRDLHPDHVEVSDRLTLRGLGRWADLMGASSVVISHERADRLLKQLGLPTRPARWVADRLNERLAGQFDAVVCATAFAQAEFDRIDTPVYRVPLGVDLDTFTPVRRDPRLRASLAEGAQMLMVHCGRLSPEKHPERSIDTAAALHEQGMRVRLVVAGDGPRRRALEHRARGLPVTFVGFLQRRTDVARLLAAAEVSLAPGPHETYGLAALESLACGTPAVVSRSSALAEIIEPTCGDAVADDAEAFAAAVCRLSGGDRAALRQAARGRAEQFDWSSAVDGMLAAIRDIRSGNFVSGHGAFSGHSP